VRGTLAQALGDRSLVVGYHLQETGGFVDDAGRTLILPTPGSGLAVTRIDDDGRPLAVLVHDESVLADAGLVDSVAAAARVAVANARLQAETRARAADLDASRRRIVEAGDAQRRRLAEQLRQGAGRRLTTVAALLADVRARDGAGTSGIDALEHELEGARTDLQDFAQGVHPAVLTERGLLPALHVLADRSAVPAELAGEVGAVTPPVETALYFVCSEALANAAKHARATSVRIVLEQRDGTVVLSVEDDGVGGADPARGSGLRGLADRLQALGGDLRVESEPGRGTRLVAAVPSEPAGTAR
jgi:signal transduction histidine kinase